MYNISRTQIFTCIYMWIDRNIHVFVKNVYVNISKYVYICTTSAQHKYLLARVHSIYVYIYKWYSIYVYIYMICMYTCICIYIGIYSYIHM